MGQFFITGELQLRDPVRGDQHLLLAGHPRGRLRVPSRLLQAPVGQRVQAGEPANLFFNVIGIYS